MSPDYIKSIYYDVQCINYTEQNWKLYLYNTNNGNDNNDMDI